MAEKIISSDQATLKLLELEEIPEFFDTISDRAHLPPLKHQGLGDRELESNDIESSQDKAPVHGSDESHLTFDSESKDKQDHLPPTDYLFSETEMWKTSRPKHIRANKKGADQSKDLTMELADFGFGEEEERRVAPWELGINLPDSWGTRPIEKGSEGYKSFDSRDISSSVVETCKICNSRRKPVGGPCRECAERERHFQEFPFQESSEWAREWLFPGTKRWWAADESQKLPDSHGHASEAVGTVNDSDQDSTKAEDSESDMSNPPSVFSLATLPSTIMTTDTRLTVDEMQTAMEELVSIFFDDTEMAGLYKEAIIERQISPQRFVRNFRRLIKQFALNLKEEAQEAIDFDLSKLISMRARLIADKIGNKLELKYLNESPTHLPPSRLFPLPTPWVMESFRFNIMAQSSLPEDMLDASSDEDGEQPAETFPALVSHGRSFILESAAIKNLRKELKNFIIPNGPMIGADMDLKFEIFGMSACIAFRNSTHLWGFPLKDMDIKIEFGISEIKGGIVFRRSTRLWGFPLIDMVATRAKFRARGMERYWYWNKFFQLCSGEEHLPEKHTRFRWTNRHGKNLYDDYVEHEPGALQALQEFLKATTVPTYIVAKGTASQSSSSAAARYIPNSGGLQATPCGSTPQGGNATQEAITTPGSQLAIASQHIGSGNQESRPLLLLCCIERRGRPIKLHQEYVTQITDDRQLFHSLRKIYFSHRRKFESFWSLRTLHSIHFMKTSAVTLKYAYPANPAPAFHHQPSSLPWAQPINADQSPQNTPHQLDPA
ncbi:hypothetical protein PoHVEF18_008221 [Penicillium ochrochloron]